MLCDFILPCDLLRELTRGDDGGEGRKEMKKKEEEQVAAELTRGG
jgi:hypothetical protein